MNADAVEDDPDKPPNNLMSGALRLYLKSIDVWEDCLCSLENNAFHFVKSNDPGTSKSVLIDSDTEIKFCFSKSQMRIRLPNNQKFVFSGKLSDIQSWTFVLRICHKCQLDYSKSQFRYVSTLGDSPFGKIKLYEKLDTGKIYALKSIRKQKLFNLNGSESVFAERNLLHVVPEFPFLSNLSFVFQTSSTFYLGLEYAAGGGLLSYLRSMPVLAINDTRLYLAQIVLALEHLHKNQIIFRDLKPENVLLTDAKQGHVQLVDFGLSRVLVLDDSTSVYGTAEYLAPEVIQHKDYTSKVDWWALGVLFYEIVFTDQPFYDEVQDVMFANIVNKEPEYPRFGHEAGIDLMKKLLVKDPADRIDFEGIKKHPFFRGLDWGKVLRQELKPRTFSEIMNDFYTQSSSTVTDETNSESGIHSVEIRTPCNFVHSEIQPGGSGPNE